MNDPTFYRTPGDAIAAPPEQLAYVAAIDPDGRVHQTRLQGGDASSDSYCFTS